MINTNLLNRRLFIIGNSHIHQFTGLAPGAKFFSSEKIVAANLGPITAYKFGEKYLGETYGILNQNRFNPACDLLITVVGEIDCRYHLLNQIINHNKPAHLVIQECAYRYFASHIHLQKSISGIKTIIMGVNPSTNKQVFDNPDGPMLGDMFQRNEITKRFNQEVKEFCELSKNIKFFSIYDYLIHENGDTDTSFFISEDDYVHYDHHKVCDFINIELNKLLCL